MKISLSVAVLDTFFFLTRKARDIVIRKIIAAFAAFVNTRNALR